MNNHLTIQKGGRLVQNMNWEKANLTNNRYRRPTSQNVRLVYFIRKELDLHYSTNIHNHKYILLNTNLATLVVKNSMHLLGNFWSGFMLTKTNYAIDVANTKHKPGIPCISEENVKYFYFCSFFK